MTHTLEYCPRCGQKTWSQASVKQYACSQCNFSYFHNVAAAVALIMEIKDRILFTIRKFDPARGKLDLPGGFIDYHESAEEGLKREILEELNIEIKTPAYLTTFPNTYVYNDIMYHTLDMFFYLKLDKLPVIRVNDDVSDYVMRYPSDITDDEVGLESIGRVVKYYLHHIIK